jgi:uncharacterized caspase-like protein
MISSCLIEELPWEFARRACMMSEITSTKPQRWALIIGINQYLQLQPLRCAQQDAQALRDWLVGAGWPSDHCLLLTDSSGAVRGMSTYPDRATITAWLNRLKTELLGPEDTLWVFFSGYGECWHREDFLMPCDAQMTVTSDSWISLRSLYATLKSLPTQNILVLLDSNRSQSVRWSTTDGTSSGHGVGEHTFKLATDSGIATILSCEPQQLSHESPAMGRGLFTAALLEGLQAHSGEPLAKLVDDLNQRLPELSEHANTPVQNPLVAVQADRLANFQLPAAAPVAPIDSASQPRSADRVLQPSLRQARVLAADQINLPSTAMARISPSSTALTADSSPTNPGAANAANRGDQTADSLESVLASPPSTAVPSTALMVPPPPESAALTLDRIEPMHPPASGARAAEHSPQGSINADPVEPNSQPGGDTQLADRRTRSPNQSAEVSAAETRTFMIKVGVLSGLILLALGLSSVLKSMTGGRPAVPGTASKPAPSQPPQDRSIGLKGSTAQLNNPGPADPNASPTSNPTAQLPVPQSPTANSAKILAEARAQIRPKTASEVALAIGQARQIPPGDVNYAEAQQQIERWSADLLDLAQQRADRGAYQDAIGAAQMITAGSSSYRAAQAAIVQWKQKLR